jgi:Rib/alpha/Esp surface antigen-like repeat protein
MRQFGSMAAVVAIAAGLGFGAVGVGPTAAVAKDSAETEPMYRLYNPNSGEHFYTASGGERDHLVRVGWRSEGTGWTAPAKSATPVYRLYNPNAGDHHYTMSRGEHDALVKVGWRDEGIGWYSSDSGVVPLYRQYNPNAKAGAHNYTTSKAESDYLVRVGWNYEGIGWYGVDKDAQRGPLADAYDPKPANLTVALRFSVDARSAIANASELPDGTTFLWAKAPDTSSEGAVSGTVTVTYPDGSTDAVRVTVNVARTEAQKKAEGAQKAADAAKADAKAKDAATAQAKVSLDAAQSNATNAKTKLDEAQSAKDAADHAVADAKSKLDKAASDKAVADQTVTSSKSKLDKAASDKSAADQASKDAKSKLDQAQSAADNAAADAKAKSNAVQSAKDTLDAAQKAYDDATKPNSEDVAQFLDSISNGKYSEWAAKTYYSLSDESVTNKANGSNMTYDNFLAALDLIDHLNQYRTTHGLDAFTVSGYEMAGQMLECDLVDDGTLSYHTNFWGKAWFKDLAWGYDNYVNGKGYDAVDGWLSERDDFKGDAEAYATNGYKVADGTYTPASDEYKAALAAVDWSSEPSIHAFYDKYFEYVDAYLWAYRGAPHEYGHWASLTSMSAKYIGMGYSTSDPHWGTAEAAAGHTDPADGDVTGTTDYFRDLVDKAKASKAATVDPSLKTALDDAQAAYDSAKSELDASNATLATAKTNLSTAQSAYDKAASDSKAKATALSTAQSAYDAAVKDAQSKATAVTNAQSAYNAAVSDAQSTGASLAKAQSDYDAAKSKLDKAQSAYSAAKAASDAADATAQDAQAKADEAKKAAGGF